MSPARKEKIAIMKQDYPLNLFLMIESEIGKEQYRFSNELTEDKILGLDCAVNMFDERRADMLMRKYRDKESNAEIAEVYGITAGSAGSIINRTIYQLTLPPMIGFIMYGKQAYLDTLEQYRPDLSSDILDKSIEEYGFDFITRHYLEIISVKKVKDVLVLTDEKINDITSAISSSVGSSIKRKLQSEGIDHPFWNLYR